MFGSIKNQLRSVIEWKNPSPNVFLQNWSSEHDEIKNASKLLVGPGQGCFFIYEGQVRAVHVNPGLFELKTANIPFWTTVTKFMQAFQSEHKVGLYFFKTTELVNLAWGTTSPVKYDDPKYKFPVGLRAFGNFSVQVTKPEMFFTGFLGVRDEYTTDQLREVFTSRIMQPMTDFFAESKYSYAEVDAQRNEIAANFMTSLNTDFAKFGFELKDFRIEGTSFDEDTVRRIGRIADMSAESQAASAAGLSYQQMQQLEAMREAARNEGGAAGLGMGTGVGFGLGQQMAQGMANMGNGQNNQQSEDPTARLKKLKDLLDQNLITKEEFETKKKEILSKI